MAKVPAGTTDEARIHVDAAPDLVYALVSDVTRMSQWSPETRNCEWVDGATGPAVGAAFRASNRASRGPAWSNKPVVIAAEPGRHFAFLRGGHGATSWHYRLTPAGTGTELTESYLVEQPVSAAMTWLTLWMRGAKDFRADMRANLETTLARIKAAAERG